VERKVLRLVRGEFRSGDGHARLAEGGLVFPMGMQPDDRDMALLKRLWDLARAHGLELLPPGTQYVSEDELAILCWLAEAQRQAGARTCRLQDDDFRSVLVQCGRVLAQLGMFLPSQTMHVFCDWTVYRPDTPQRSDRNGADRGAKGEYRFMERKLAHRRSRRA
jgi:hypothetical protein